ncbi:MAG: diadenylate cyclase [Faecalibacterium prausnitzii]
MLPLSNNLDLGKDMGTRHRACLGIAENSDAIAIVVSEETGIISMAKNGVLIRHFDRQSLYTRLIDEMIPKESTVEKNTADSWVEQAEKLWNWISQKGRTSSNEQPAEQDEWRQSLPSAKRKIFWMTAASGWHCLCWVPSLYGWWSPSSFSPAPPTPSIMCRWITPTIPPPILPGV